MHPLTEREARPALEERVDASDWVEYPAVGSFDCSKDADECKECTDKLVGDSVFVAAGWLEATCAHGVRLDVVPTERGLPMLRKHYVEIGRAELVDLQIVDQDLARVAPELPLATVRYSYRWQFSDAGAALYRDLGCDAKPSVGAPSDFCARARSPQHEEQGYYFDGQWLASRPSSGHSAGGFYWN
ncbi:MAG: hypothetical protein U0271_36700 [Polyangiaceae bacterium]